MKSGLIGEFESASVELKIYKKKLNFKELLLICFLLLSWEI